MLEQLIGTTSHQPHSALEIEQRVREREALRLRLAAQYRAQNGKTRRPMRKGLLTLILGLFSQL